MPFTRQCRKIWHSDTDHRLQYNRPMDIYFLITMLPIHESEIFIVFTVRMVTRTRLFCS